MADVSRQSPVRFAAAPVRTETKDNWQVVLEYDGEDDGPHLVDLSHKQRWDLQDADPGGFQPCGVQVPDAPGRCAIKDGVLINRMNRTQAAIWQLAPDAHPMPEESAYTDVSEATVFLAMLGPAVFHITEKLTSLDFLDPRKAAPFLLQGPFCHVPCQIVTLEKAGDGAGAVLFTSARGYARDMVDMVLAAGAEFGLCPAGEAAFQYWLESR